MGPIVRIHDLPIDPQGHVHGPSAMRIGHSDRLGHVVGVVAAVFFRLEPQPGAVTTRVRAFRPPVKSPGCAPVLLLSWRP
jgi:hypothetical protein